MKNIFYLLLIFFLSSCRYSDKKPIVFPSIGTSEDEWAVYEGRWLSQDGIIEFELKLKTGTGGIDTYYKLHERMLSTKRAGSLSSQGMYSSYYGLSNKQTGIWLHDLDAFNIGKFPTHLRFKKSLLDDSEEMFFITRGIDELLPSDNNFKPIASDWQNTLHKRSKLFTVEGYITFDQSGVLQQDTAVFFERNTMERWRVTNLGEFNELRTSDQELAKEKQEGIYLKALAYSVTDTTSKRNKTSLVIKEIKDIGNDPD